MGKYTLKDYILIGTGVALGASALAYLYHKTQGVPEPVRV
jgi:hypothetical protein